MDDKNKLYAVSEQITSLVKEGDDAILRKLYHDNYPKVERYILLNSGNKENARDIFQEAFLSMWRNIQLEKFNPVNEDSLGGYLFKIAKYKWIDYLRSGHFKKTVLLPEIKENNEMEYEEPSESEKIISIRKSFELLGTNCKELLNRFYYQSQTLKQIAAAFNWTEASTKNNKYRCMQKLKELLKN